MNSSFWGPLLLWTEVTPIKILPKLQLSQTIFTLLKWVVIDCAMKTTQFRSAFRSATLLPFLLQNFDLFPPVLSSLSFNTSSLTILGHNSYFFPSKIYEKEWKKLLQQFRSAFHSVYTVCATKFRNCWVSSFVQIFLKWKL